MLSSMKKILLTGGGTAGHVTPNIALLPKLKELGYEIRYVGSYEGIEKSLIEEIGVPYTGISSGKLRRYLSVKNLTDPFRVLKGFSEAKKIMKEYRPDVVFSKGGFVSVPVIFAAKKYKIPTIIHESDMTPGLANKLSIPSATKVCHNFPETAQYLPKEKAVLTGSPIREELLSGDKDRGLQLCGFHSKKPVIMVIGGSLGAVAVNNNVRSALPKLLEKFQVVHLCGQGKTDETFNQTEGYKQFEYVKEDLCHLFAMADIIISRAGANAICEIAALKKPSILIPLSAKASRGDQILNANSFKKQGFSEVLDEDTLNADLLVETVDKVYDNKKQYINALEQAASSNAIEIISQLIEEVAVRK